MRDLRPIDGLPPEWYAIGDDGVMYSRRWARGLRDHWRPMKPSYIRSRLQAQAFDACGKKHVIVIARAVCRAFHGPQPLGCVPYHYPDPDRRNCRADNLRWAPVGTSRLGNRNNPRSAENVRAAARRMRKLTDEQVIWARQAYADGQTLDDLAEVLGINRAVVGWMVTGQTYRDLPGAVQIPEAQRKVRGSYHPAAKLDELAVDEIRQASAAGESGASIARRLGTTRSTVNKVLRGESWKHVVPE